MAWEIWMQKVSWTTSSQCGFFCNTSDHSFGHIFYIDCWDRSVFYEAWNELGLSDPRTITDDELYDAIIDMKVHFHCN